MESQPNKTELRKRGLWRSWWAIDRICSLGPNCKEGGSHSWVSFSYLLGLRGSHVERAEWCLFCWFNNYCIATAQSWAIFQANISRGSSTERQNLRVDRWKNIPPLLCFQAVTSQISQTGPQHKSCPTEYRCLDFLITSLKKEENRTDVKIPLFSLWSANYYFPATHKKKSYR